MHFPSKFPPYQFSDNSQPELFEFMKTAEKVKHKNQFCDLTKHQLWNTVLPMVSTLGNNEKNNIIILGSSDEEPAISTQQDSDCIIERSRNNERLSDVAVGIKESLEAHKCLSEAVKRDLKAMTESSLAELFVLLSETLNSRDIHDLGFSLTGDVLIASFCHNLLFPRLIEEFTDELLPVLHELAKGCPFVLKTEFIRSFSTEGNSKGLLQGISHLNNQFRGDLLRSFVFSAESLNNNALEFLVNLVNNETDREILLKLVNLEYKACQELSKSKLFGKLVMNTIQFLDDVKQVEQPLRYIIENHSSVWKANVEKELDSRSNDGNAFSE